MRTNDVVLIGLLQAILEEEGIPVLVADNHMSAMEGMIGAFPRRILVPGDRVSQARRVIAGAGLGAELRDG